MKAATVIAVALATFSSFPSTAQQATQPPTTQTTPLQSAPSQAQPDAQPSQTQPGQIQTSQTHAAPLALQPISAELISKLDSKSAKQGDSVILKTDETAKTPDGTEIPRGSKLVGHVTNVQARGDGKENSQIAIQFDRAELKGGQTMPIESVIQSISPSMTDMPAQNGGMPVASAASPTSSMAGSGSNPASNNSGMNQAANADRPGLASNTTAQAGATTQDTSGAAQAPGSIVARNGNVAIRITAIPGLLLANNINGQPFSNASGMLLGARRDIKLEGGTRMVVAVAAAPQSAGSGMSR